jgi:hypothetical protein
MEKEVPVFHKTAVIFYTIVVQCPEDAVVKTKKF